MQEQAPQNESVTQSRTGPVSLASDDGSVLFPQHLAAPLQRLQLYVVLKNTSESAAHRRLTAAVFALVMPSRVFAESQFFCHMMGNVVCASLILPLICPLEAFPPRSWFDVFSLREQKRLLLCFTVQ